MSVARNRRSDFWGGQAARKKRVRMARFLQELKSIRAELSVSAHVGWHAIGLTSRISDLRLSLWVGPTLASLPHG